MSTALAPSVTPVAPSAEPVSGPNILSAAARRWPWVVIGMVVGTVAGFFLMYASKTNTYQSSAQILVVKKRGDVASGSAADGRMALLEDYVATQVQLLRSEKIMQQVADNPASKSTNIPLPEDPQARARALISMMTVAREKDPSGAAGGTNVLNLTMKGGDAGDCQKLLDLVITTYSNELNTVYDEATTQTLATYDSLIRQDTEEIKRLTADRSIELGKLAIITPEDVLSVRSRVTKAVDAIRMLENDQDDIKGRLKLIDTEGKTPQNRALLLAQLSDSSRYGVPVPKMGIDVDNPESATKSLELEKAELSKKFRPDHPTMQALDSKLAFLREMLKRPGGDATASVPPGSAPADGLSLLAVFLRNRLAINESQLIRARGLLKDDTETVTKATVHQNAIEDATRRITDKTRKIEEIQNKISQTKVTKDVGGYQATRLSAPTLEPVPISPKLSQALLAGMAAGLFLGLGMAVMAELSDKSFRSPAEIRARLGLAVIGHIPPIRTDLPADAGGPNVEPTLVTALRPKSVEAEAYRGVRTALFYSTAGRGHAVIQVTSPNPGDGKSTLAANLAASIAQSGKTCILIDCDFRRPRQHKMFRLDDNTGPGFVGVIVDNIPFGQAVRRSAVENLYLLPCGTRPTNPGELLTSLRFKQVIEEAKLKYDFVILDTPPLLAVSDPAAVTEQADGVILVFRMTSRARPQAERAREQLTQLGANVLGVVVNGAGRAADGYGYGGGAGYHYDYEYEYSDTYHDEPDDAPLPKKG